MAGVTSIEVKESLEEFAQRLRQTQPSSTQERLQVLYWLKQATVYTQVHPEPFSNP